MENNKQTAVGFLENAIDKYIAYVEGSHKAEPFTITQLSEAVQQAKEMEKQQHQATFNQGYDRRTYLYDLEYGGAEYWNEEPKKFEQYYNEEYGK